MPQTKLRQQRVDGADLNAVTTTAVSETGGIDVVVAVSGEQRQGRKAIDDQLPRTRSRKALQKLLQDETREQRLFRFYNADQFACFNRRGGAAAERERPDARIDKKAQPRLRSAL